MDVALSPSTVLPDPPRPPLPAPAAVGAPPAAGLAPFEMVRALLGWVGIGAIGLATQPDIAPMGVVYTLAAPAGALLLTVPALLVGHQYLNLHAPPAALVGTLLRGFCRAGDVALGMVPIALLFAATSSLGPAILVLTLLGACVQGLLVTMGGLNRVEATQDTPPGDWAARSRMGLLVLVWGALYGLIGLRLTWNLLDLVFSS